MTRMEAQSDYWPVSFRRSCAAPIQPGRCGSGDSASVTAQCTRSMHTGCRGTDVRASVGRAVGCRWSKTDLVVVVVMLVVVDV